MAAPACCLSAVDVRIAEINARLTDALNRITLAEAIAADLLMKTRQAIADADKALTGRRL